MRRTIYGPLLIILTGFLALVTLPTVAQSGYPTRTNTFVNDFADFVSSTTVGAGIGAIAAIALRFIGTDGEHDGNGGGSSGGGGAGGNW